MCGCKGEMRHSKQIKLCIDYDNKVGKGGIYAQNVYIRGALFFCLIIVSAQNKNVD